MLKHSPAPWTIEPGEELEEREIWDANLQCIASVWGAPEANQPGSAQDQLNADTRILQASYRMYALLHKIVAWNAERGPCWDWLHEAENILNDIEE
jgi:hypothetical protein